MMFVPAASPPKGFQSAFTLVELMVVVAIMLLVAGLATPAFKNIRDTGNMGRAMSEVGSLMELARTEAMATRSYVYLGFVNYTDSGTSQLKVGSLVSIDGSSDTTSTNLRPLGKILTLPNITMTDYSTLPPVVQAATDISLQTNSDYVTTFATTTYFQSKFSDTAFAASCPTVTFSPQGEVLNQTNPAVFFRTTTSMGLVPTHGTTRITTDGGVVSYYGGTGQVRYTRPKS